MEYLDQTPGTGFRSYVAQQIFAKEQEIESWFEKKEDCCPVPPYTSIDLRDSGFKSVPVDSNTFPAGFNNICIEDWKVAAQGFQKTLKAKNKQSPQKILLIAESYTSNPFYFENLRVLREMLQLAGFPTTIGHCNSQLEGDGKISEMETSSKQKIILERVERRGQEIFTAQANFSSDKDLILLNNDLSGGLPEELEGLDYKISPNPSMGWFQRKKSTHLTYYNRLARELAQILQIDPFLITARFSQVSGMDFQESTGLDTLAKAVDKLVEEIRLDYKEQDIQVEPFVFIKDNSGTHGRSIMVVKSGSDILQMNRRTKTKMNTGKGGVQVNNVLLMEGIPTDVLEEGESAEPVIYLAGSRPIGGFLRIHPKRSQGENLNAPGAYFKTLCFANLLKDPSPQTIVLEKFYGMLGRLSTIANGQEMNEENLEYSC